MMDIAQGVEYTALSTPLQIYRSFATTVSQIKICDLTGENFKSFEVL